MLFSTSYKTIEKEAGFVFKEKGSRFIALAFPVKSEIEIRKQIEKIKIKYADASHHCYAYVLGYDYSRIKDNDDGEPSNTAGKPILRQLRRLELTNTLVVVVRYFGGTKLGIPGLIEAYGSSAAECLKLCSICTHDIYEIYKLTCPFGMENEIYRMCKQFKLSPGVMEEQGCFCAEIKIPLHKTEDFKRQLENNHRITFQFTGTE